MAKLLYNGYINNIAEHFEAALLSVKAIYNFDLGNDFEAAFAQAIGKLLPQQFGAALGHVINEAGDQAGDDVIIFDRLRYPTLRVLPEVGARKEWIPVEATFGYIEAKYTLEIEGNGKQSIAHAAEQVSKVKALCHQRAPVAMSHILPGVHLAPPIIMNAPSGYPGRMNPAFGGIVARHVRARPGAAHIEDPQEIHDLLLAAGVPAPEHAPDFIVAGQSVIVFPVVRAEGGSGQLRSPFFIPGNGAHVVKIAQKQAFGIAVILTLQALDWMRLGQMPWTRIIKNALDIQ
jgi:hypothetical protein